MPRSPRRPRRWTLVALLSALLLSSGCAPGRAEPAVVGGSWAEIVARAADEGVTLYSVQAPQTLGRLEQCFTDVYPDIAVYTARGTSSELVSRVDQERESGAEGADVWITTELGWLAQRSAEGALLAPRGPGLATWPREYLAGDAVVAGVEPMVITYNTDLVGIAPTSYADLLAPSLRGRVGSPELAATITAGWYAWLEEGSPGYLAALAAQGSRLYAGSAPIAQAVASGEIAAAAYGIPTAVAPLREQGAPIDYVVPEPGFGVSYGTGALGWSPRPNAALVMVDFLMSPEGQACWHGTGESASPRADTPGSLPLGPIDRWDHTAWSPDDNDRLAAEWNRLFRG